MTSYEEQQAQYLDEYLNALQQDRNAAQPADLDPEMAEFARMMVGDSVETTQETTSQKRVWDDIQATQNIVNFDERKQRMKEKNKNGRRRFSWIPIAATAAATVIVTLLAVSIFSRNPTPNQGAINDPEILRQATQIIIDATNTAAARQNATATPMSSATASSTFAPTAMPPAATMDQFQARATQLVADATVTAQAASAQATAFVISPTPTLDPLLMPPTAINPGLSCDFEGEFLMYFNQNTLRDGDTLVVQGMVRNTNAISARIEIFGGTLTDDNYLPLSVFEGNTITSDFVVTVPGDAYDDGSYLVQIRLLDADDETLSSCGLPVTFVAG